MSNRFTLSDPALLRQQCYIDGRWVDADDGATVEVHNPANGAVLATVPRCGAAEARRAIESARAAFPAWAAKSAKERGKLLRRLAELMVANHS
jgi:succinate-semialdehyde dehydrogenase / glutarate-semialdehyde dehydrogenase